MHKYSLALLAATTFCIAVATIADISNAQPVCADKSTLRECYEAGLAQVGTAMAQFNDLSKKIETLSRQIRPPNVYASDPVDHPNGDGVFLAKCDSGDEVIGGSCTAGESPSALQSSTMEKGGWSCVWTPRITKANARALCWRLRGVGIKPE